jgi:hypothetical protein
MNEKRVRKAAREKILLLCTGFTIATKGRKGISFLQVTQEEYESGKLSGDHRPWAFLAKGLSHMNVTAGVFEVESSGDSIFTHTANYIGMWKDKDFTTEIYAERKTRQIVYDANKRYEKDKNINHLKEALTPVRHAYHSLPNVHKHVFLAMVVSYITGYRH